MENDARSELETVSAPNLYHSLRPRVSSNLRTSSSLSRVRPPRLMHVDAEPFRVIEEHLSVRLLSKFIVKNVVGLIFID
jgi:hypothetical protein